MKDGDDEDEEEYDDYGDYESDPNSQTVPDKKPNEQA